MLSIQKDKKGSIPKLGMYVFPFLTLIYILLYFLNESLYRHLIKEDSITEWLTFLFLIVAGFLSFLIALRIKTKHGYFHWFFILFFAFNILAGMEEISWGQRVFGLETTGVFKEHSDQNEINLHNTFQGIFQIKTKHIALVVLFVYGVILPWLMQNKKKETSNMLLRQFIFPPIFLSGGFLIASILMLDFQTGHEEEIGELFFSLCFFIMMLWNLHLHSDNYFQPESVNELGNILLKTNCEKTTNTNFQASAK